MKDTPAAVALFGQAAERRNARVMTILGALLSIGEMGVAKDMAAAVKLCRQAA